ncbi:MAG TPA: flagellin [Phycisphaerales bacterium]|nr:flagellin [Phycisphaerales bacterium]
MAPNAIQNNVPSMIALRMIGVHQTFLARSMERLATGFRVNRGADDPAGMISSQVLSAELASLDAEGRAAERSDALASVADGALGEISDLLDEANTAAIANANTAGLSDAERDANQLAIDSAMNAVDRIASTTSFNGQRLFDGSAFLQSGSEVMSIDRLSTTTMGAVEVDGEDYTLADVRSGQALDTANGNAAGAQAAIASASSQVASMRGSIGAFQKNTIDSFVRSVDIGYENLASALSIIRDTDFGFETAELSRQSVLRESSFRSAMTANNNAWGVLGLLS